MKRLTSVLCALALSYACGGSSGGSTAPTPVIPAPTLTTSNTMIFIGQTVQFTASGGGTMRWGGDAPAVATVDATSGRVTGVSNGRVTIWAENESGRTTRLIRVLPSYAGNWSGTYAISGCQATGDIARIDFCDNFYSGQVLNMQLQITQTDDRVSGTLAFGELVGSLNTSTVAENGQLPLTGLTSVSEGSVRLDNGRFESHTAGVITGTFDQIWSVTGASGFGILRCSVRSLTRTSGGPSLLFRMPGETEDLTFEEMIRRVLRR